jgi:hypothetical protein
MLMGPRTRGGFKRKNNGKKDSMPFKLKYLDRIRKTLELI